VLVTPSYASDNPPNSRCFTCQSCSIAGVLKQTSWLAALVKQKICLANEVRNRNKAKAARMSIQFVSYSLMLRELVPADWKVIVSCLPSRLTRNVEVAKEIACQCPPSPTRASVHDAIRTIHDNLLCIHMRLFMICVYTSSTYSPWLRCSRAQRHAAWRPIRSRMIQEPSSQSGSPASYCLHAWYWQHNGSSRPRSSRPLPLLLLISPHIIHLRSYEQEKCQNINPEQSFVAFVVKWLVICAVDV
jgi:hypothetical protein